MKIFSNYIRDVVFLLLTTIWHQALTIVIWDVSNLNPHECAVDFNTHKLIYDKNEQLVVTCRSSSPVIWSYPKFTHPHNFESVIEIQDSIGQFRDFILPYYSQLIVHNATFAYTGFYGCQCSSMDGVRQKQLTAYVYVKDPDHLLTFWEYDVFNVSVQIKTTLSWCRPTSPDVHVAIMLEGKTIVDSTHVSYPFTYDPRYGFTVENIYKTIVEGNYVCKGTDSSRVEYKKIEVKLTALPLISFKTEKEFYKLDEPISIECHISSDSFAYGRLEWNNDTILTNWIVSNTGILYSTSAKQSGKFYCKAQNEHGIRYEVLEVLVTDLNKICDMWSNESNKSVYEGKQIILECGATKQKYNNKIQWYFNNDLLDINQLPKDYSIVNYATIYSYRSMLIITDVNYANTGNYECRVEKETKSCGQIKVDVQGKLRIQIRNESNEYEYKTMMSIKCVIFFSLPIENINWYFIKNGSNTTFDKSSYTTAACDENNILYRDNCTETILNSIVFESGTLRCEVSNGLDQYFSDYYIHVTEQRDTHMTYKYISYISFVLLIIFVMIPIFVYIRKRRRKQDENNRFRKDNCNNSVRTQRESIIIYHHYESTESIPRNGDDKLYDHLSIYSPFEDRSGYLVPRDVKVKFENRCQ